MNEKPTALYRHFAADGSLLYVGISLSHLARLCQHRETSGWYGEIARVEIEWFPHREAALSAEKVAIVRERPRHNVIHARFDRQESAEQLDDFPADLPWPIPAKFALIAWGIRSGASEYGAVAVGYQPHKCGSAWWFDKYTSTAGASCAKWRDYSDAEMRNAVLVQYFTLTNVYEIDPRVASQAFLNIQEFRDAIEAGPLGPNLIESDLPYIAKSDPRPEHRFWHSVHVFPRAAAQAAAA